MWSDLMATAMLEFRKIMSMNISSFLSSQIGRSIFLVNAIRRSNIILDLGQDGCTFRLLCVKTLRTLLFSTFYCSLSRISFVPKELIIFLIKQISYNYITTELSYHRFDSWQDFKWEKISHGTDSFVPWILRLLFQGKMELTDSAVFSQNQFG